MPVQISITRGGQAMTLQCLDEEWERVRKRFGSNPEGDEVVWVEGTDGERMGFRLTDVLAVIYLDEETIKEMRERREARQRIAQARGLSVEEGDMH